MEFPSFLCYQIIFTTTLDIMHSTTAVAIEYLIIFIHSIICHETSLKKPSGYVGT